MRFTYSNLDPQVLADPKMFCFWLYIHIDSFGHRHTQDKQSHEVPLEAQTARTHIRWLLHTLNETSTWSLFSPVDGCNNIWASCQGWGYYGNDQTVEWPTSLLHNCEGGPVQGRQNEATLCGVGTLFLWPGLQVLATASPLALWAYCLFPTVYPATWCLSISFGLWPASVGSLGPGQTHPGVSIETADPGCEFLVLENPMWWL